MCAKRVREYNSFETWDISSADRKSYQFPFRPMDSCITWGPGLFSDGKATSWKQQHARERSRLPPLAAALGHYGCELPYLILLKSVKLKSSKWDQNGILKSTNSIKVAYVRIVFILAHGILKCNLPSKRKTTKYRIWLIWESPMWYSCSHVGAGEEKASLLGRRNIVHQKCLFFHTRAETYFNMPWCPFSLKINTLILWSTITSGRVSTFQTLMRYSKAALLPNRMRSLCWCSHFPAKTSRWSVSVLGWGGFLSPWQLAAVHTPQRTASHHPGRTGNAVPYLKATFPKDKTKQHRRERETPTLTDARWNNLLITNVSLSLHACCRLCFKSLWGRCFVWLKYPAGLISVSQTGGSLCVFSIYLSPFKQLPINLEIHISPPHRASSRQQSQTQHVQRSCLPRKAEGPQSPPHLSWGWGRPKTRVDDMQEQIIVSCAMIK